MNEKFWSKIQEGEVSRLLWQTAGRVLLGGLLAVADVKPVAAEPEKAPLHQEQGDVLNSTHAIFLVQKDGMITVIDFENGARQELIKGYFPVWSPDGKMISFISSQYYRDSSTDAVGSINIYSTEQRQVILTVDGEFMRPIWSADGKYILAILKQEDGNMALVLIDLQDMSAPVGRLIADSEGDYSDWIPHYDQEKNVFYIQAYRDTKLQDLTVDPVTGQVSSTTDFMNYEDPGEGLNQVRRGGEYFAEDTDYREFPGELTEQTDEFRPKDTDLTVQPVPTFVPGNG